MRKSILHSILILSLAIVPASLYATPETPVSATEAESAFLNMSEVNITVKGRTVQILNATGETLEVYNVLGVRVATYKIDTADKSITLTLGKGCYILRVGKATRKISLS